MFKWKLNNVDDFSFSVNFFHSDWRNISKNETHEKFAQKWTEVLFKLENEISPAYIFIELYSTMAGNIIGSLEAELTHLELKFENCKHFNIKNIGRNLNQFTFLLPSIDDLEELI